MSKTARHKSANNVDTYNQDASTRWELVKMGEDEEEQRVGPFRCRYLTRHQHGATNSSSTPFQKPLYELVHWWYDHCLQMRGKPFLSPISILVHALKPRDEGLLINFSTVEKSLSASVGDPALLRNIMAQVKALCISHSNQVNNRLLCENEALIETASSVQRPVLTPAREALRGMLRTVSPRSSTSLLDLTSTQDVRKLPTDEKLAVILSVRRQFNELAHGVRERCNARSKTWMIRHFKVLPCLDNHFHGDIAAFALRYGARFAIKPWKCNCGIQA